MSGGSDMKKFFFTQNARRGWCKKVSLNQKSSVHKMLDGTGIE